MPVSSGALNIVKFFNVTVRRGTKNSGRARHSVPADSCQSTRSAGRGLPTLPVLPSLFVKHIIPPLKTKSVEESLRKSEQHYSRLLEQSQHMQKQLRRLSRQILLAQEEERREISRELHDVIAQTLTGINIRLGALKGSGHQHQGPRPQHRPHAAAGGKIGGHRASVRA